MRPYLVLGALLLAGSGLTAVVPVLPRTFQPPSIEHSESRQLDGVLHQTLTVGLEGAGAVAARVVEVTDDVTDDWTNEVSTRRRRDTRRARRQSQYESIDRYDGPVQDEYQEYQDAPQNEYFPEDIEEVRYTEPQAAAVDSEAAASSQEYSPYQLFPQSFHDLLDIPIHVYKNGTEVRTHERPPQRQPTVSGGYANTNLQGYGSGGDRQPSARPVYTPTEAPTTTTTTQYTTRRPETLPPRRNEVTEEIHFVTTTPRARIVTPGSGQFGAVAQEDPRRPVAVTVKPSHELPDRVAAFGFGFGATGAGEEEEKSDVPRLSLHEKLAIGRKPEKTRKRVPFGSRPTSNKRPAIDWSRGEQEEEEEEENVDDNQDVSGSLSEYFAANTDFGANFGGFGQKNSAAVASTTTTTTTTTTTATTRAPLPVEEVYHVTPSAVEPPSWQLQWTSPQPEEEPKKSTKKPIFKKPAFQKENLPSEVGIEQPSETPLQPEHRQPSNEYEQAFGYEPSEQNQVDANDQSHDGHFHFQQENHRQEQYEEQSQQEHYSPGAEEPQPKPFSQPIDPFSPIQDPFSEGQGPSFSPQEPVYNPHQEQFHQEQFQPATPDLDASISVTSGPNLSAGPGSGIQQLPGPTFGGQPTPVVARPPRPFGRPPNRPPRPGRPQRPPVGDRRPPPQQNRPVPPSGNRPVAGFAGRPPVPQEDRPVPFDNRPGPFDNSPAPFDNRPAQFDNRPEPPFENRPVQGGPGSRPRRPPPPPPKKPANGGYLDSFLSWFRGGDEEGQEGRPSNVRPGPPGPRPQDRFQGPPNRPGEQQRPGGAPQGFPPGFGGEPSPPFTPPPPHLLPGHGPDGNPGLERAPGTFVRQEHPSGGSEPGFGGGVLPQFRPGVAGPPRLAHRRRGTVQRRRGAAGSERFPNQQTVTAKTSKPVASSSERIPTSTTADYVVATPPAPRRRRPRPPRPAASQTPPRRRVDAARPASEDPRPPVIGRPTVRPATLLNEKRIMVVGPFGAPPPGAPYIRHPSSLPAAGADVMPRSASSAGGDKMAAKMASSAVPTSTSVGAKLSFSPQVTNVAAVGTVSTSTGGSGVSSSPSTESYFEAPEDGSTGDFKEPEMYSGFRPILN